MHANLVWWSINLHVCERLDQQYWDFFLHFIDIGSQGGTDENCNPEIDEGETYDMVCVDGGPSQVYGNVEFLGKFMKTKGRFMVCGTWKNSKWAKFMHNFLHILSLFFSPLKFSLVPAPPHKKNDAGGASLCHHHKKWYRMQLNIT